MPPIIISSWPIILFCITLVFGAGITYAELHGLRSDFGRYVERTDHRIERVEDDRGAIEARASIAAQLIERTADTASKLIIDTAQRASDQTLAAADRAKKA